jgi:enoyl-CoA hydratase/carnithine racemase
MVSPWRPRVTVAERLLRLESGPIAHLILCAPPRNEMGPGFFEELEGMIADEIPRIKPRGLVVRGEGRHFSSGADVAALRNELLGPRGEGAQEGLLRASFLLQAVADLPFPVVAAIGGVCLGSGLELALACHFRVAAASAVFSLPETTFGLMPGCGGTQRLPVLTGVATAAEWILTGRMVTAEEALARGLVDVVVDRREVVKSAEALVRSPSREGGM